MFRAAEKRLKRYGDGRATDLSGVLETPSTGQFEAVRAAPLEGLSVCRGFLSLDEQVTLVETVLMEWSGGTHNNLYVDLGRCPFLEQPAVFDKVRWTTLGHHYDWTRRTYYGCDVDRMPEALVQLGGRAHSGFVGDAAIVNLYPLKYQLCGHRDDAEPCGRHPVVSWSIGCAAVFLVGATTPDVDPVALWLRSGDCCKIGGASRFALHGVPRVEPDTCPPELTRALRARPVPHADAMANFIGTHRININLRVAACSCEPAAK